MLRSFFDLLLHNPLAGLPTVAVAVGTLLMSLVIHEFSHALVSLALGDNSQRKRGRLSLNPLRHLDPLGTFFLLFVGFGWAKPVQTDERRLKPSPVLGMALVGAAGPLSNLLLAALVALPYRLGYYRLFEGFDYPFVPWAPLLIGNIAFFLLLWNIVLGVFNSIPVPPLDGSWVLRVFLPRRFQTGVAYARFARWGTIAFIAMIGIQYVTPYSPLAWIVSVPLQFMTRVIVGRAII